MFFSFSAFLSFSRSPCFFALLLVPPSLRRPSFSSSVGHVSNHPTKEEKTSGNSYSPTYNSKSGFTLLEMSSFSSSLVRHIESLFSLFIFPTFKQCNFDIKSFIVPLIDESKCIEIYNQNVIWNHSVQGVPVENCFVTK